MCDLATRLRRVYGLSDETISVLLSKPHLREKAEWLVARAEHSAVLLQQAKDAVRGLRAALGKPTQGVEP